MWKKIHFCYFLQNLGKRIIYYTFVISARFRIFQRNETDEESNENCSEKSDAMQKQIKFISKHFDFANI